MENAFQVGSWLAQPGLNAISQNGKTIHVEPKVMEVLICLAKSPGQTISKEDLIRKVWPDTFVTDDALTRAISELRHAFDDDPKKSRVIQTIPKRGYRLVPPVVPMTGSGGVAMPEAVASTLNSTPIPVAPTALSRNLVVLLLPIGLTVLGLFAAAKTGWVWNRWGKAETPQIHSLAVLPLQNLSGDPNQEYFADGMTEELITEVSRLKDLKVISRTSVMPYKKTDKSLPEIARELNVDAIVAGSVLRSGDRVRVTAQLTSAQTDTNLWAETYDRSLQDTLAIQETVASAIAAKIKTSTIPALAVQPNTPPSVNLKAHEAYLRGFHEWDLSGYFSNRQDMQAVSDEHGRRATAYFRQALQEDPNYAPAYMGLADNSENPVVVEAYARKALEIDDSLARAHVILGAIRLACDLNWQEAEREFRRSIEVNPNEAAAHRGYAYLLDAEGRLEEGLREYQQAQLLDPANDHMAPALYSRRQYDRLIELENEALARTPGNSAENTVSHKTLMVAYARTGRQKESIQEFELALTAYGWTGLAEDLRRGYARGGYKAALREWLKGVKKRPDFPFTFVETYVYAELGDYDRAIARLPELHDEVTGGAWGIIAYADARWSPTPASLRVEPMWDPLHSDPRFEAFARQVGLPAEPAASRKP